MTLPDDEFEAYVFCDACLAFKAGTAEILGQFTANSDTLVVELAHIDGGGEGVLPALWLLAERYARKKHLQRVEWIVHAVNCATPNLKLRRILERKGFVTEDIPSVGQAYHLVQYLVQVSKPLTKHNICHRAVDIASKNHVLFPVASEQKLGFETCT